MRPNSNQPARKYSLASFATMLPRSPYLRSFYSLATAYISVSGSACSPEELEMGLFKSLSLHLQPCPSS